MNYSSSNKFHMSAYLFLFALGSLFLSIAVWQYSKTESLLKRGKVAVAEVVEMITHDGNDGATYSPVFEFKDITEQTRRFNNPVASNPPAFQVGDMVPVVYDPADVQEIKVVSYWGLYRWVVIPLVMALPLLTISIGNWLFLWRFK